MLNPKSFSNPLIFFANGIGDHLVVMPTLRALSKVFNGRISLACSNRAFDQFYREIKFNRVLKIPVTNMSRNTEGYPIDSVARSIFDYDLLNREIGPCDLFISLVSWESESLARLLEINTPKCSIGHFPSYTYEIPDNRENVFDRYFGAVRFFDPNLKIEDFSEFISPPRKYIKLVRTLRDALGKEKKLLVVHTDTKRRKMWEGGKFITLLDSFLSVRPDYLVAIVGLYHELNIAKAKNGNRIFSLCGVPLGLSFSIVNNADMFLGVDSSMLHAADLSRVPSIGLFGPSEPSRWGFRFSKDSLIISGNLEDIYPNQVETELTKLAEIIS